MFFWLHMYYHFWRFCLITINQFLEVFLAYLCFIFFNNKLVLDWILLCSLNLEELRCMLDHFWDWLFRNIGMSHYCLTLVRFSFFIAQMLAFIWLLCFKNYIFKPICFFLLRWLFVFVWRGANFRAYLWLSECLSCPKKTFTFVPRLLVRFGIFNGHFLIQSGRKSL